MIRKKPTLAWNSAIQARPLPVAARQITTDSPDPVPDLRLDFPPPLLPVAVAPPPPRPRVYVSGSSTNANAGADTPKPEVPVIAPQLTTEEAAVAKQQVSQSMSIAERNLAAANGKKLNATQVDLTSKVRSFLADAREAGRAGDWIRARDLARKAQVLSEELANSL